MNIILPSKVIRTENYNNIGGKKKKLTVYTQTLLLMMTKGNVAKSEQFSIPDGTISTVRSLGRHWLVMSTLEILGLIITSLSAFSSLTPTFWQVRLPSTLSQSNTFPFDRQDFEKSPLTTNNKLNKTINIPILLNKTNTS